MHPKCAEQADSAPKQADSAADLANALEGLAIEGKDSPSEEALAEALSTTMGQYHGKLVPPKDILRWVSQFPLPHHEFILRELQHVFTTTFITTNKLNGFLDSVKTRLEKKESTFWTTEEGKKKVCFLQVQKKEKSQGRLNQMFMKRFGEFPITSADQAGQYTHVIYLDDALYTGQSLYNSLAHQEGLDLSGSHVYLCVLVIHAEAWERVAWTTNILKAKYGAKSVSIHRQSDVSVLYSTPSTKQAGCFSSPQNRETLYNIFKDAAKDFDFEKIKRKDGENVYAPLGINSDRITTEDKINLAGGFGSPLATCDNCPNNAPAVLWWTYDDDWFPLLPKK